MTLVNDILPDCMIPDGADPCRGYKALAAVVLKDTERLASYLKERGEYADARAVLIGKLAHLSRADAEMRAALEPFAKIARDQDERPIRGDIKDDEPVWVRVTWGEFKQACAALASDRKE